MFDKEKLKEALMGLQWELPEHLPHHMLLCYGMPLSSEIRGLPILIKIDGDDMIVKLNGASAPFPDCGFIHSEILSKKHQDDKDAERVYEKKCRSEILSMLGITD